MRLPITVAILAGGRSERMGRDKAEIVWRGETLLARTARIALETDSPVIVVGRERPDDWPHPEVTFVPDAFVGQGPLGGLATALQAAGCPVLALACDMPLLTVEALRWLMLQERGTHGVAVRNGENGEPLFSIYTPAVLPLIDRQMATGRRSLQALIASGDFRNVTAPPAIAAHLANVNTPEELGQL